MTDTKTPLDLSGVRRQPQRMSDEQLGEYEMHNSRPYRPELEDLIFTLRQERAERRRLEALLNTPELDDFMKGVPLEAAHQRQRWGSDHDDGKTSADWFWLIGYLAGKALHSQTSGNIDKALHHVITAAAALANWHAAILGKTDMRPGISDPEKQGARAP